MALRKIRQYGDDILKKKAKPVVAYDAVLHHLLDDMWETLRHYEGLGMAAPQVGVLRRIIVIELEDDNFELINPQIIESSGNETKTEACLSVPNKQGEVDRPVYVKVRAQNRYNEPYELETDDDMLATAICHEMDHLDGVLFIDRAKKVQDRPPEEDVKKAKKDGKIKRRKHKRKRNSKVRVTMLNDVPKMAAGK